MATSVATPADTSGASDFTSGNTPPADSGDTGFSASDLTWSPEDVASIADEPAEGPAPEGYEDTPDETESRAPETIDTPNVPAEEAGAPEIEPVAEPVAGATATPAAAQPPTDDLPEGVTKAKNRKGEEVFVVTPERWKAIYDNGHKVLAETSQLIGEPATLESLRIRQEAYEAMEELFTDVASTDPTAHGRVLDWAFGEMVRAQQAGEVGGDPRVTFAQTFYNRLAEKGPGDPAYQSVRMLQARDFMTELYADAIQRNDVPLFKSVQNVIRAVTGFGPDSADLTRVRQAAENMGLPFHAFSEMDGLRNRQSDPVHRVIQENQALRAQLNGQGNGAPARTEQFSDWIGSMAQEVNKSVVDDIVTPALKSVADAWKDYPKEWEHLVINPIVTDLKKELSADTVLQDTVKRLERQARIAVSPAARTQFRAQIKQAYKNSAALRIDRIIKGPLEFASKSFVAANKQTHQRRQVAVANGSVNGTSAPVNRGIAPPGVVPDSGAYDPAAARRELTALFG